jgi:parallel beta-helix repeat protein
VGVIYIRADGSIDPPTAPISTLDNITYTFVGDIFNSSVVIERDNIIIDGASFRLYSEFISGSRGIDLTGRSNVTIKNTDVKNYLYDIYLYSSSNNIISKNSLATNYGAGYGISLTESSGNSISENNIAPRYGNGIQLYNSSSNSISGNSITTNFGLGILLNYYSCNNIVSENNITDNFIGGIRIMSNSNGNKIYHNNFMNNTSHASASGSNVWDDGSRGNYWSDYLVKHPNAAEIDSSGVWNIPYVINPNDADHYPLMAPYVVPEFPSFLILPLFFLATLLAVITYRRKHFYSAER